MRVFFSSLGCKLNQAEVDAMARQFVAHGHLVVGALEDADLHVVNSCTVTHQAERDSRKTARRSAREGRGARTVLTGCYASADPGAARALQGVDLVVANRDKERLVELVSRAFPQQGDGDRIGGPDAGAEPERETSSIIPVSYVPLRFGPARALVKIEDGCDMRCAFCVIPRTRGPQRSRALPEVVAEVRELEAGGYAEIVITGVQISAWRDGGVRLPELLDAVLATTTTCRFRLTSIAPWELDSALLDRFDHPRLCRHLHLSLQSGDDLTLRRMRRPYTAARFAALVDAVRARIPGVAITTDVIVGFPGETDQEFESSLSLVAATGFARVHVFGYSLRPGTEAATLPHQVEPSLRRERMARMLATAAAAENDFRRAHVGENASVLWEGRRSGRWLGTTDNYLRVFASSDADLRRSLTTAKLVAAAPGGMLAEL